MNLAVREFQRLAERHLEEMWALFPHEASDLGMHEFDAELGENSSRTWQTYEQSLSKTLEAMEAQSDGYFAGDQWLDRRGFLSLLRTRLHWVRTLERWRNDPQVHCDAAINSIFHLVIRNSERLAAIRPAIESRLAKLPRFLAHGAACLRHPVPLWTRLARRSCEGAATFFQELGAQLAAVSPQPKRTLRLASDAGAAFRKYAIAAENKRPGPRGGFAIGSDGFEFLVRERTGLPYHIAEIKALSVDLVAKLERALALEAKKFGRRQANAVLQQAAERWKPRATTLVEEYRRVTQEMRNRFERSQIVTFPKRERCEVRLVPPFLRHHFPTAAYLQPGAFDKDQTGIFWVNDLSTTQTDPRRRAAEVRQHFGLEFTCAHEAYPGHHLQFVIQNKHASRLRRLFAHAIFYEGWTLWCEKMAVDRGVIAMPEAKLIQLHDALWRAHRIAIDCGLHDGSLTYASACERLQKGVGFTAARARGDVNWYTSAPTVPMSYLLGRLEVERLHAHLVGREGWTLRQFNDWMLSHGAIPWRWIWDARLRPENASI